MKVIHSASAVPHYSIWTRIGAAWDHEDGKGFTVQLELVPVTGGRIVLRVPNEPTEENEAIDPNEATEEKGA